MLESKGGKSGCPSLSNSNLIASNGEGDEVNEFYRVNFSTAFETEGSIPHAEPSLNVKMLMGKSPK